MLAKMDFYNSIRTVENKTLDIDSYAQNLNGYFLVKKKSLLTNKSVQN